MSTEQECTERAAITACRADEELAELLATGRAVEAARQAGCVTDAEIDAWLARFAPDQPRTTREEYIRRGCEALAEGIERATGLIRAGRAVQAAQEAGCKTDAEIDAYLAEFAPDQRQVATAHLQTNPPQCESERKKEPPEART